MANFGNTFDASQVDPNRPQETLPPGDYLAQIIHSEFRPTKAGTGQYLFLEMDVVNGPHAGGKLFDRLNLINPNSQAVEIAQRTLSAICHAIGRMQVSDSEELHFQPLLVKVAVGQSGYNEVKGYKPANQQRQPAPPVQTPPGAAPQQTPAAYQAPRQQSAPPPNQAVQPQPAPAQNTGTAPWRRMG